MSPKTARTLRVLLSVALMLVMFWFFQQRSGAGMGPAFRGFPILIGAVVVFLVLSKLLRGRERGRGPKGDPENYWAQGGR